MTAAESTCWTVIRAAAAGSPTDREELARRYLGVVRAYLVARWRGSELRSNLDDAIQEVFVECFRQGGVLTAVDAGRVLNFRPFLYGVIRNVARRFESRPIRSGSALSEIAADEDSQSDLFERTWAQAIMAEAAQLQRTHAAERGAEALQRIELLRLRFEENLPIRTIAERRRVDAAALHHSYALARQEFRAALLAMVAFHQPGSPAEVEQEAADLLRSLSGSRTHAKRGDEGKDRMPMNCLALARNTHAPAAESRTLILYRFSPFPRYTMFVRFSRWHSLTVGLMLGVALGVLTLVCNSQQPTKEQKKPPTGDYKEVNFLDLNLVLLPPEEDKKTGFVVAGKNSSNLIRGLKQINGRTIQALELDMRPGKFSMAGFLGKDEKLLDVLVKDNEYVVDQLGMSHQELARQLYALEAIFFKWNGGINAKEPVRCTYCNRRYEVWVSATRQGMGVGGQESPFKDGTATNAVVKVHNVDNGQKLEYSALVSGMVERYGFYEGKGTPFRVEPKQIVEVFDFLKASH